MQYEGERHFLQRISKQRLRLTAQTTTGHFDNFRPKVVSKLSNIPAIEMYVCMNVVTQNKRRRIFSPAQHHNFELRVADIYVTTRPT
jgi:hypothetical protein